MAKKELKINIQENVPLAGLTTFKIGGRARYFIIISKKEELIQALKWARQNKQNFFILAGGSNILVNDNGVDALVIKLSNKELTVKDRRIECGAGCELAQAVISAASNNLSGLEWAAGIPGSVGGAIRGNAGAFGSYISKVIETVEVYDIDRKKFLIYSRNDCAFDYRQSIFKQDKNLLIWQAIFRLKKGEQAEIKKIINNYIAYRQKSQPNLPSAGCVFKNIKLSELKNANPSLASRAEAELKIKNDLVSAGWIISQLDLSGKAIGNAKISLEHANFVVNTGQASAADIVMLISYIKQQVRDNLGIQLREEIEYVGFD